MTTYILPVYEIARAFKDNVEPFFRKYKLIAMGDDVAAELTMALTEDLVASKQRWDRSAGMSRVNKVMDEHYSEWWVGITHDTPDDQEQSLESKMSLEFYEDYLSDIDLRIGDVIDSIIPDRTWDIWYMRRVGQDLAIEHGPDFRILDWERRMKSGEWSFDD